MKHNIFNRLFSRPLLAANTAILANAAESISPFAILQGDSFFIPYGDFPHKQGLQKFDRAAADLMAANHKGLLNRLATWARGDSASYPVYIGHPDLPGSKDTDKRAYGWIENLIPEADGMRLPVKWSESGRELVENAHFKFYSPLWWTVKTAGGIRPTTLKSMGLTNDPNIPVPALANSADAETQDDKTQDTRLEDARPDEQLTNNTNTDMTPELLAALGLDDTATPADVLAKIKALQEAATPPEESPAEEVTETPAVEATEPPAEEVPPGAKAAADACEAAGLKDKLKTAANDAVQAAVTAGKVLPAEARAKVDAILAANDFGAELAALRLLPAKMKVASSTGPLGAAKVQLVVAANDEASARRQERALAVANEAAAIGNPAIGEGERKRIAWERAQRKNPTLFKP